MPDKKIVQDSQTSEGGEHAIEASWAPSDPRDRLHDEAASSRAKGASLYRIIAAFHPVLNIPVLIYDSFKKLGWQRASLVWFVIIAAVAAFIIFYR